MTPKDPYFTPIKDKKPLVVPDTISTELTTTKQGYQFLLPELKSEKKRPSVMKGLLLTFTGIIGSIVCWETYATLIALTEFSAVLGGLFGLLLFTLTGLSLAEVYRFRKSQRQLLQIDALREQAELFIRERSHGKSASFINQLTQLYNHSPQGELLQKQLLQQPDYLNDAEIISYLSESFYYHLDQEAQQLITAESIKIGTLIALSPLAIVDSLVVLWRTMKMINQINTIYGLRLTRIGQWQVFIKIIKATLLAAGTEIAISSVVDKATTGVTGIVTASVAQGVGVGIYAARIGVESMKQMRQIAFTKSELKNINLLTGGIKLSLNKIMIEHKKETD